VVTNESYTRRGLEKKVSNDLRIGRVIPSCISAFAGRQNVYTLRCQGSFLGSSNTPKFSKMVSWKYSHMSPRLVREDLEMNHCRPLSTKLV
jgi:hypothetical protein